MCGLGLQVWGLGLGVLAEGRLRRVQGGNSEISLACPHLERTPKHPTSSCRGNLCSRQWFRCARKRWRLLSMLLSLLLPLNICKNQLPFVLYSENTNYGNTKPSNLASEVWSQLHIHAQDPKPLHTGFDLHARSGFQVVGVTGFSARWSCNFNFKVNGECKP